MLIVLLTALAMVTVTQNVIESVKFNNAFGNLETRGIVPVITFTGINIPEIIPFFILWCNSFTFNQKFHLCPG